MSFACDVTSLAGPQIHPSSSCPPNHHHEEAEEERATKRLEIVVKRGKQGEDRGKMTRHV